MNYIARIFKINNFSEDKKTLLDNFLSLSLLQVANYILPLITLPYLVRVLGPEKFGLIAFAQAFMQYFIIFSDYGFNLSATRDVSVNRDNKYYVSRVFSSVMVVKLLFIFLSFIFLLILIFLCPKFRFNYIIYLFSYGIVLGNALYPVWFFQGMERMRYIAVLNLIAKAIFTISIFIFIKNSSHYIYVPLINAVGFIFAGFLSLYAIFKTFNIIFYWPNLIEIKSRLKDGWHIFISKISISLYTSTNTFILGLFTCDTIVGYYAAAERLVRILIRLFEPLYNASYPYISKVVAISKEKAINNLRKLSALTILMAIVLFILFFVYSKNIVFIVLGPQFIECDILLKIMAPLIIIVPLAYIFANLALLPFKMDRYFSKIYIFGGALNILLLIVFLYFYRLSARGAAIANLITELILTIIMYIVLRKKGIKLIL